MVSWSAARPRVHGASPRRINNFSVMRNGRVNRKHYPRASPASSIPAQAGERRGPSQSATSQRRVPVRAAGRRLIEDHPVVVEVRPKQACEQVGRLCRHVCGKPAAAIREKGG